jgi:hypothetical protein
MKSAVELCGVEFLALGAPARLAVEKCRAAAALTINWRLAVEGRAHPAGEVVVGFGSVHEVEAAMRRARAEAVSPGGLFAVEYAPPPRDEVRVGPLLDVTERGRAIFAAGAADRAGWFAVFIGEEGDCQREATRLRRVRSGHRSTGGRP